MNPASASEEFSSHTAHPSQSATTAEAPLEPQNAAPVPRIVARSRRFERRGPRGPRKPAESLPSALRSAAPAGPVFVPAAEVHRPAPPAVEAGQAPPPAEPLSAALLARRWLNATS